jgi:hypothetical protein
MSVGLSSKNVVACDAGGGVFKELEEHLKRHDWYYAMSDDHHVWESGEQSRRHLVQLMLDAGAVDKKKAKGLFDKYRPHDGFSFPL